jgi:hypothetical protein
MAVAQMHAVEVADGHICTPEITGYVFNSFKYNHVSILLQF